MYIENVVVGNTILHPSEIFARSLRDWVEVEEPKTIFVNERSLPQILKNIGIVKSISEVRRNKPQLCIQLDKLDYLEVKWGKRKIFILVGE